MAAKKKAGAAPAEVAPAIIAIPEVNMKDLKGIMKFADNERRTHDATVDAERALSALVRTADEIAQQAGDIASDAHTGSPIERERHARKIGKAAEALEKVRISVAELAAV